MVIIRFALDLACIFLNFSSSKHFNTSQPFFLDQFTLTYLSDNCIEPFWLVKYAITDFVVLCETEMFLQVHLLDLLNDEHKFLRTFSGGGVGAIAVSFKSNDAFWFLLRLDIQYQV